MEGVFGNCKGFTIIRCVVVIVVSQPCFTKPLHKDTVRLKWIHVISKSGQIFDLDQSESFLKAKWCKRSLRLRHSEGDHTLIHAHVCLLGQIWPVSYRRECSTGQCFDQNQPWTKTSWMLSLKAYAVPDRSSVETQRQPTSFPSRATFR